MASLLIGMAKPTREEKIRALTESLNTLYRTRAEITTEILARRCIRTYRLNISVKSMQDFIYSLSAEERSLVRMPSIQHGGSGTQWYHDDGTPNRPQ